MRILLAATIMTIWLSVLLIGLGVWIYHAA